MYLSEAPLAFTSTTDVFETEFNQLRSFTNAFPANSTLPTTAFNRYLPRVVTCVIKASDPGNNGLPVYATGQYVAIANSSSPYGIELRPNFAFPVCARVVVWVGGKGGGAGKRKRKKKRKYEWAKETTMFLFARMSPSFSGRAFLLFVL